VPFHVGLKNRSATDNPKRIQIGYLEIASRFNGSHLNPFRSMGLKFALRPTTHKVWVFCTVSILLENSAGGEYPNRPILVF
jgi:hypothetical protein